MGGGSVPPKQRCHLFGGGEVSLNGHPPHRTIPGCSCPTVRTVPAVPKPKKYKMSTEIDDEIRKSCW